MVFDLVDQRANEKCTERIPEGKRVILDGWKRAVKHRDPEVFDINVYGIQQEEPLHRLRILADVVEYCGKIHKECGKDAPKVLNIAEEYEERRQYKTDSHIEDYKANDGEDERKEGGREGNLVHYAEEYEHYECHTEIDQRGYVF